LKSLFIARLLIALAPSVYGELRTLGSR
jgi:hypothetical protein